MQAFSFILLTLFMCSVKSEDNDRCISYTFEDGFEDLFSDNKGICSAVQQSWDERLYSEVPIPSPNQISTTHISPRTTLSCASSFTFTMTAGGILEFNVFMSGDFPTDQLTVLASQYVPGGHDISLGNLFLFPDNSNFVRGWSTHRINLIGVGTFPGYVTFMGMKGADSILLVDSFRYIPPNLAENDCPIY